MFVLGEFLAQKMRDRDVEGQKPLLEYLYMIMQLCLATGVQELPSIDEMIKAINTIDLGLIRDTTNLLARKASQGVDCLLRCTGVRLRLPRLLMLWR